MRRNSFLKFGLVAAGFACAPFKVNARKKRIDKGVFVGAGKDRFEKPLSLFDGDIFYTKIPSSDTDGDLYIFESTRIKEGGPPLHFHYEQDEWWYIISGEFLINVGEQIYQAKAGDCVFGPRGVPHTFAKVGEGEARLIMLFQPAGKMEEFFKAVSEGKVAKMSDEERDKFRIAHGFEHIGPPLKQLKKP
jgi:mannose-6-phosphate isomerase-like protein (cupin superfamily)